MNRKLREALSNFCKIPVLIPTSFQAIPCPGSCGSPRRKTIGYGLGGMVRGYDFQGPGMVFNENVARITENT